jgi:hypothetical protein
MSQSGGDAGTTFQLTGRLHQQTIADSSLVSSFRRSGRNRRRRYRRNRLRHSHGLIRRRLCYRRTGRNDCCEHC